jgi:uncharacterized protein (TIGR00369 family)
MDLKLALFKPMLKLTMERTGHGAALGFEITRIGRGEVELVFPYKSETVGNPITGVVHGGVIVSLLDTCCGSAAITMLNSSAVTPTMDLRLDYMHPAKPFEPIYVAAKVYKNTSNVIFCRGSAWQDDRDNPIAHCVANFMRVETSSVTVGAIIKRRVGRLFNRKNQTK